MTNMKINLVVKVEGLDKLEKLAELVGQINEKPIEVKLSAGLPDKAVINEFNCPVHSKV